MPWEKMQHDSGGALGVEGWGVRGCCKANKWSGMSKGASKMHGISDGANYSCRENPEGIGGTVPEAETAKG